MALLSAGYHLTHFYFILFIFHFFSASDETEYEYSGSEEEDEERDMGEPRSVSLHMYTHKNILCNLFPPKMFDISPVILYYSLSLVCFQLYHQHPRWVNPEAGLPAPPAGQ